MAEQIWSKTDIIIKHRSLMRVPVGIGGMLSGPLFIWGISAGGSSPALALGLSAIFAALASFAIEYFGSKPNMKIQISRAISVIIGIGWIWLWMGLIKDPMGYLGSGWTTEELWILVMAVFVLGTYLKYKTSSKVAASSTMLNLVWKIYNNIKRNAKNATEGWIATPGFHILIGLAALIMWLGGIVILWATIEPLAWLLWIIKPDRISLGR